MRTVIPPPPAGGGSGDDEPDRSPNRSAEDRAHIERYRARPDPLARALHVQRFLPLARQLARRYQRP